MTDPKKKRAQIAKRLRGILLPREWDAEGNILSLSLMAAGEKEYVILGRQMDDLVPYVRQQIDAECEILDATPSPRITILSCRPTGTALCK